MNAEVVTPKKASKSKVTVAGFLTSQIDSIVESGQKTQKMIAEELGYPKPNIITMFKQGLTNLPINKVEKMAKAIYVDPVYLLRLVMMEYIPESYEVIDKLLGEKIVTENEMAVIKLLRAELDGKDPNASTSQAHNAIKELAKAL